MPVLHLPDGQVIDESFDIMLWALAQTQSQMLPQTKQAQQQCQGYKQKNDGHFKDLLRICKYHTHHEKHTVQDALNKATTILQQWDQVLNTQSWFHGSSLGIEDILLFPFIRQFAGIQNLDILPDPHKIIGINLKKWLNNLETSACFKAIMAK